MNHCKNRVMLFGIILLFCVTPFIKTDYNRIITNNQEESKLGLSDPNTDLSHHYDFENDTIGQDPTGFTLSVNEPTGCTANIENLGDSQQKHLALNKVGSISRVWVRDNFSLWNNQTYTSGEYHLKVYHDNSGFGINLNSANMEYILAMVWWNGEIRDDMYGTLLATYTLNQWSDVVIYFDLSLGWMFDLDGVRYGEGYDFPFFGAFTANAEHFWITSFVSGGGDGYFRVDDIAFYPINITSPENNTYTKPMDGYYPATYGFENDKYGEQAQGWWTENEVNCDSQIIDNYDGHNNVYELYDNSGSAKADVINNFENKSYGTIELWFELGTSDYHAGIVVGFREPYKSKISFQITPGSNLYARNGTVLIAMPEFGIIKNNSWYHLRFDFRAEGAPYYMGLSEDSYMVYLNGIMANSELSCNPLESAFPFNSLQFSTGGGFSPDYLIYFDAIGYSWEPNYYIGDNLDEGLLLSYENQTALDWQGYSLDGQPINTIMGNTTIPMPEDGVHTVQVFGNDTLGTDYQSAKRYFTVDFPINIITPEAKTYNEAMDGYYPATHGFENTKNGSIPKDWTFTSNDPTGNGEAVVIDEVDGHKNVVRLKHGGTLSTYTQLLAPIFDPIVAGSVEWWMHYEDNGLNHGAAVSINKLFPWETLTAIGLRGDGSIMYYDGGVQSFYGSYSLNTWYHFKLDFDCSTDKFNLTLDGNPILSDIDFTDDLDDVNELHIQSDQFSNCTVYYDAFGYSWEPGYNVGDNLNEGLLLSFENSTTLNWTGYSLDGQAIKTILGNTTIPLPADGKYSIKVYGNDSLGIIYQSHKRLFSVHHINITTPEDKVYSKAMSGYYPATYGFEETKTNTLPSYCDYNPGGSIPDGSGSYSKVIDNWTDGTGNTHKKVLKTYDRTASGTAHGWLNFTDEGSEICRNSTIEFWACNTLTGVYYHSYFSILGDLGNMVIFEWESYGTTNAPEIRVTPSSGEFGTGVYQEWDRWYRYSIDISCDGGYEGLSANQFRFRIYNDNNDLIYSSADLGLSTSHPTGGPYRYHVLSTESQSDVSHYLDGFSITGLQDNYIIGDNLNEGLLLSYENSTALDWQGYSLDGQPTNTIMGNTTLQMPSEGHHSIQVFGNDNIGAFYQSEIRHFEIDYHPIKIITPENKTYTEPMDGYYPATYGYEDEEIGSVPRGTYNGSGEGCNVSIIDEIADHKNVMELFDGSSEYAYANIGLNDISAGTVDLWVRLARNDAGVNVQIADSPIDDYNLIQILFVDDGMIKYKTGVGQEYNIMSYSPNQWYHLRIEFDCSTNWHLWINNVSMDGGAGYSYRGNPTAMDAIRLHTDGLPSGGHLYVDAIGFSWDPNYDIGDNMNEGLLLSFENKTSFDWMGYSLDGQTNKTIKGNTTINMPSEGVHTIQVFANDSLGTLYQSELRYFTVNTSQDIDLILPVIAINAPIYNDLYGSAPPSYNLTIVELNLNTIWYTLDAGLTNTTITEPTGIIAQSIWSNHPNGTVTIGFYADDIAGNIGFEDVVVRKDVLPPVIVIISPNQNQVFRDTPPSFDLSITDGNLDSIWYTLDDGIVNVPCDIAGAVNPIYWSAVPPGDYTLKFYAIDTLGNVGSAEVIVKKREPSIPGYNPIILSLILAIGTIYIMRRINKKLN